MCHDFVEIKQTPSFSIGKVKSFHLFPQWCARSDTMTDVGKDKKECDSRFLALCIAQTAMNQPQQDL